jgi:GMP reductase
MKYLYYKDVALVPRHSSLESRSHANTSVEFLGHKFSLPVVPANMKDVINPDIAKQLCQKNVFYIMHRWFADVDNKVDNPSHVIEFVREMNQQKLLTSISVGVGTWWEGAILCIKKNGLKVDFITVDVAHSDHENVKNIIRVIKHELPETKLIVGNVATSEGCEYLIKLGVDAIKVGIGGGRICTTKNKTGFTVPMFSCILQCQPICEKYGIPIIADGGVEEFGDIAKALVAGADMVMAGGIFAECIDSPAEIVEGKKQYRGSTSYEMKGQNKHVEGRKIEITHSVNYSERLEEIKQALQSSISYAGGDNLSAFNLVNYIVVS